MSDIILDILRRYVDGIRIKKASARSGGEYHSPCPKCGGEMYQRDDDNETTVRNRLDVYAKSTSPLIDYYKGKGLLKSVDGDRPVDTVYVDVKAQLGL